MTNEYTTRSRRYRAGSNVGVRKAVVYSTGQVVSEKTTPVEAWSTQTTRSRDTLFPKIDRLKQRRRRRGKTDHITEMRQDIGGSFSTTRRYYSDNGALATTVTVPTRRSSVTDYNYTGPILASDPGSVGTSNGYPSIDYVGLRNEMTQLGTTAIARCIPTNPAVGAAALIGESMERLPSLPGKALLGRPGKVSKKFADEYLNYEFGLKPLISDVGKIAESVKNSSAILEQLRRDSGRLIRRRYEFPVERTSRIISTQSSMYSYPGMDTVMYAKSGTKTISETTEKRVWFSGAFTYHFDQGSDLWSRVKRSEQEANRLFGLRLTPSLAWELAPWSWAADWVTNAGDVITNLSAFSRDGLVLRWGYVMCTYRVTRTHELDVTLWNGAKYRPVQNFTTVVKERLVATPYGFGLDPDWKDFSSRQLAILGALGISRVR